MIKPRTTKEPSAQSGAKPQPRILSTAQLLRLSPGRYLARHMGVDGPTKVSDGVSLPFAMLSSPVRDQRRSRVSFFGQDGNAVIRLLNPGDQGMIDVAGASGLVLFTVFNAK